MKANVDNSRGRPVLGEEEYLGENGGTSLRGEPGRSLWLSGTVVGVRGGGSANTLHDVSSLHFFPSLHSQACSCEGYSSSNSFSFHGKKSFT